MPNSKDQESDGAQASDLVSATSWTVVLAALTVSPHSAEALEALCNKYWYPVYTYIRRRGYASHDAEDLTQGFFYELVNNKRLRAANPSKGKFRAYLLAGVNGFLANHWHFTHAAKRGGYNVIISLDAQTAEERYAIEPLSEAAPDQLFEKQWAMTVMASAQQTLALEYKTSGKEQLYNAMRSLLTDSPAQGSYGVLAAQLGITENALAVKVHRLRERFRAILREEIAQTVETTDDIDIELKHLASVLARG